MFPRSPKSSRLGLALGVVSVTVGLVLVGTYLIVGRDPAPDAPAAGPGPTLASVTPALSASRAVVPDSARQAVAQALADRGDYAAVGVVDAITGATLTYHETLSYQTASIVKVDILAALLWRHHERGEYLSDAEDDAAEKMITASDNTAASTLYAAIGGEAGLNAANRAFGLTHTVPGPGAIWGKATTTVSDQLRLLAVLNRSDSPLSEKSRGYILGLMAKVRSDQRWGVPAAAGPQATEVNVKNGWDTKAADGGLWMINSIGRIVEPGHVWLVVALSSHNKTELAGRAVVERAAKLAVDGLRQV